ncbi:MAG TPA: biotin--[acetyl-CoA-carboxylase] ligase [Methylomirabilota bacterium]|nr:biotin--[acetyl-CoA-carboxylase] ligase [Methylomirabilota bacterium]
MSPADAGGAQARVVGHVVHALDEVGSTQTEAARFAAEGAPEGLVVSARHQRAGRGRLGRAWWDRPGESLLLSVLLRPRIAPSRAPQLTLVGALGVVDAVAAATGLAASIRWPNDVQVAGRKICGILAEATTDAAGSLERVILGIGLNVNQDAFPPEVAGRAASLRMLTGRLHDRAALLDAVLEALDIRYRAFLDAGAEALAAACRERCVTLGERIRAADGREGVAVDLDASGALLLRADDGAVHRVVAGEVAGAPAA